MKKYVAQPRIPEHARYGKAREMVEKKVRYLCGLLFVLLFESAFVCLLFESSKIGADHVVVEPEPEEGSPRSVVMEMSDGGSFPRYCWGGGGREGGMFSWCSFGMHKSRPRHPYTRRDGA